MNGETRSTVLIEVRDLSKSYRRGPEEVHAVRGVRLSIDRGEMVALFGPSGSGKSTLLNILFGWEQADRGEVAWSDGVLAIARPWSEVAMVPQGLGLLEELSVRENVELPVRLASADRDELARRVDGLLSYFGLDGLSARAEVSIGEQQRTAVARALVLSPLLLLADEPTGHQDEGWGGVVMRTLRMVTRRGTSCLIATHNAEVVRFADRVLAIRDGTIA